MKRNYPALLVTTAVVILLSSALLLLGGCAPSPEDQNPAEGTTTSHPITVVSREDGSGTRGAFVELFEVQNEGSDGKKVDATTPDAIITNATSVALTTVAGDPAGIGYISLGSLNDTVKALEIDGAAATTDNVRSGAYPIQRSFNIATKGSVSDAAQDFIAFILSKEGQQVIEDNHYLAENSAATSFKSNNAEGKVIVGGSSSVSPVMEKLSEAYRALNPKVTIEIQTSDSSTGMSSTISGVYEIGMASRELKESELSEGLTPQTIAIDGIAVIVNNENPLQGLSTEQVRDIYLGTIRDWNELAA